MVLLVWPQWTGHTRLNPKKSNNNFEDYTQTQRCEDQTDADNRRQNTLVNLHLQLRFRC